MKIFRDLLLAPLLAALLIAAPALGADKGMEHVNGAAASSTFTPASQSDIANLQAQIGASGGNVGSYLASGCGVALRATTAYTYDVAACSYVIQGASYTADPDDVTLDTADATNDRIDSVIVDDQGVISVATGTAAANPLEPSLDPATQLRLASIYVTHDTTAPVGATNEPIFTEGAEWTPSAGTGWNASDTANPHSGTIDLKATGVAAGTFTTFTRGTSIDPTTYQQLNLWIAPVTWGTKRSVELQFLNANGAQVGSTIVVTNNSYGFTIGSTAQQLVVVPMAQFAIPAGATVKAFRIYAQGNGGTFTFYVDDISLQATTNTTATGGLTLAQADARYMPLLPRTLTFVLGAENGAALTDGDDQPSIFVNRLGKTITITEVWCESDGGTPTINLQHDDGSAADILSSNLSCSTSGAASTTFSGSEASIANGDRIDYKTVSAGGTAKRITVGVKYTY